MGRETVVTVEIGTFNPTNDTDGFTVIPGAGDSPVNVTAGANPGGGGGDGEASLPSGFDSFDAQLDDQIGLVSVDDPDFDAQFFPRPPNPVSRHRRAAESNNEFDIEERGIRDFFRKIGNHIRNVSTTEVYQRQVADRHHHREHERRKKRQKKH